MTTTDAPRAHRTLFIFKAVVPIAMVLAALLLTLLQAVLLSVVDMVLTQCTETSGYTFCSLSTYAAAFPFTPTVLRAIAVLFVVTAFVLILELLRRTERLLQPTVLSFLRYVALVILLVVLSAPYFYDADGTKDAPIVALAYVISVFSIVGTAAVFGFVRWRHRRPIS